METYKEVIRTKGISCNWVFKKEEEVTRIRYKVRLVARGFTHEEGIDYTEVFAPMVKHRLIRLLLSLVEKYKMDLE